MAVELIKTGVITAVSRYFAVVKVPIEHDDDRELTFNKKVLYTFGMKCEGHIINILEQGMEVNVLYKFGLNQNPIIIAVWLGNRPDNLQEDASCLQPIFDQLGRLIEVNDDHCIVECDDFQGKVFVRKSVVYHEGFLLDEETGPVLEIGDSVSFDAVPLRHGLEVANYIATCAWLGAEPPVVNRFQLAASDQDGEESKENFQSRAGRYAEGIVAVVPNDAVAFVDVDIDDVTGKVLLFRSCFKSGQSVAGRSLKDLVAAGDLVRLRIRRGWMYPGRKLWFAIKAWKCSNESSAITEEMCSEKNVVRPGAGIEKVSHANVAGIEKASHENDLVDSLDRINVTNSHKFTESSKVLFRDPPLRGCISRLSSDYASISFRNLKIYVEMGDVYVDGSVCTLDQFNKLVSSGKQGVNFEAVSSPGHVYQRYGISHSACCVWIGEKPTVAVITSGLDPPDLSLLEDENRTFIGQVVKFCLPKMALISLKRETTTVCVHMSRFLLSCEEVSDLNATIADFVNIGEYFEFKISRWNKWLTAVDIRRSSKKAFKELTSMKEEGCNDFTTTANSSVALSKVQTTSHLEEIAPVTIKNDMKWFSLSRNPNFTGQLLLLHCKGTLIKVSANKDGVIKTSFTVDHALGSSSFIDAPVVYGHGNNQPITSATFMKLDIWFDAVVMDDAKKKLRFRVERMWIEESGRQPPETLLRKELFYKGRKMLALRRLYRGTVKSIPLYDCAIVFVSEIPVLVTLQSLIIDKKVNESYASIDLFLKVGDEVLVLIPEKEADYYKASMCWSSFFHKPRTTKEDTTSSDAVTLLRIESWKSDDFYAKGTVFQMRNGYYVNFTTAKRQQTTTTLPLDLFANGKVFVDGKFISLKEADGLQGREVSFYVAYSPEREKEGTQYGLYVVYAWADDGPLPWAEFDKRLSVPKGLLCPNWLFEAVVECLPVTTNRRGVPQNTVCSIGPLPVLVPKNIGDEAENKLTKGERVCLRVLENTYGEKTALVSNAIEKIHSFTHVLRLKGKVESLPKPVGIIKTIGDVEVAFELCHVLDREVFGCNGEELSAWFKRVSEVTRVGSTVYFTAVKINGKTAPYRALEVWPCRK